MLPAHHYHCWSGKGRLSFLLLLATGQHPLGSKLIGAKSLTCKRLGHFDTSHAEEAEIATSSCVLEETFEVEG